MNVSYRNKKIEKICTNANFATKEYGAEMSDKIQMRIEQISAAENVEMMIEYRIGRCHPLVQNRKGQYAVDLVHPYRLVFEKVDDAIQIAKIIEIVDYH